MVRGSVDLLELLRKQAAGGDLDFLREAVAVLAEAVMEAEVAAQIGAGAPTWSASSPTPPQSCAWSARCSPSSTTSGR